MIYAYPCRLTPDEDGGFVVTFRDVPEAITGGDDHAGALAMAEDALASALAGYVHEEWEIPTPSVIEDGEAFVAVPSVVAAKLALYSAMKAQRVSRADLARRLGISEAVVRKMANPDDRSNMDRVQQALRELGHSLKVEVTAA